MEILERVIIVRALRRVARRNMASKVWELAPNGVGLNYVAAAHARVADASEVIRPLRVLRIFVPTRRAHVMV